MTLLARIAFATVDFWQPAKGWLRHRRAIPIRNQKSIELGVRAFAARRMPTGIFGGTATSWSRETICRRA